jgi:hypothetical protein
MKDNRFWEIQFTYFAKYRLLTADLLVKPASYDKTAVIATWGLIFKLEEEGNAALLLHLL